MFINATAPATLDLPNLFTEDRWHELAGHLRLTGRQVDVARLMCRGLTKDCIAYELGISANTVRMHSRALFSRLDVQDRVGAIVRLVTADRQLTGTVGPTPAAQSTPERACCSPALLENRID